MSYNQLTKDGSSYTLSLFIQDGIDAPPEEDILREEPEWDLGNNHKENVGFSTQLNSQQISTDGFADLSLGSELLANQVRYTAITTVYAVHVDFIYGKCRWNLKSI